MVLKSLLLSMCMLSFADCIALMAERTPYGLPSYFNLVESDKRGRLNDNKCSRYMEPCVPDQGGCCGDLVCRNILRDFCLYPLEQCRCTKLRIFQGLRK